MGLPIDQANVIAKKINKAYGGLGWKARVHPGENEVLVTSSKNIFTINDKAGFVEIVGRWTLTIRVIEEKLTLVIW